MNKETIQKAAKEYALKKWGYSPEHTSIEVLYMDTAVVNNSTEDFSAGASWMQGEGERLRECYTKEQVIAAIKEECIATYGGLSHDGEGNEINTPYTCLGIIHAAFDRLTPKP